MKINDKVSTEVTLPAGEYYVGDPCYVVPDEHWIPWLSAAWARIPGSDPNHVDVLVAEVEGHPVVGLSTAYGDGQYEDEDGDFSYPVDAGMIGVVPKALAKEGQDYSGSNLVTFEKEFTLSRDDDGTLYIGHITIKTADDDGDDEGDFYGGWR